MSTSAKLTIASVHTELSAKLDEQADLIKILTQRIIAQDDIIESLKQQIAARPAPAAPLATKTSVDTTQVTWEGTSRAGTPCRRIGKGDASYLEDFTNGVWTRRGAARTQSAPPPATPDDYPDCMFA